MIRMNSRPGIVELIIDKGNWHYNYYKWDKISNIIINKDRYIEPEDIHFLGFDKIKKEDEKYLIKLIFAAKEMKKE